MSYSRFPCGTFESLGGPWELISDRPMPCTPAGDLICKFESKADCDEAVRVLNHIGANKELAVGLYKSDKIRRRIS